MNTEAPLYKGVILAGGTGSRLFPITLATCKQLLPVYDKPMIYYPLSVLMLADIREILIITRPQDEVIFKSLLGDGSNFGINLQYATQSNPEGIAQALIIAQEFIGSANICLILGDNIFYGNGFTEKLKLAKSHHEGATLFSYHVNNPQDYGVVEFDKNGQPISIVEKPISPRSSQAVTGLYFYDNQAVKLATTLSPSSRGELEITDLNNAYLDRRMLRVIALGRGYAWLDTGTQDSLLEASQYIQTLEQRQGLKVACLEEIALSQGWIDRQALAKQIQTLGNTPYGRYLQKLAELEL